MTKLNIAEQVQSHLARASKNAEQGLTKYKQQLLATLEANLKKPEKNKDGSLKTGEQKIADNAGIIERYKNAKPHPLTQMQQAFAEARYVP